MRWRLVRTVHGSALGSRLAQTHGVRCADGQVRGRGHDHAHPPAHAPGFRFRRGSGACAGYGEPLRRSRPDRDHLNPLGNVTYICIRDLTFGNPARLWGGRTKRRGLSGPRVPHGRSDPARCSTPERPRKGRGLLEDPLHEYAVLYLPAILARLCACNPLTPREVQVAVLAFEGLEPHAIGSVLGVKPGTAKTHVSSVRRKLEVHSDGEFVRRLARALVRHMRAADRVGDLPTPTGVGAAPTPVGEEPTPRGQLSRRRTRASVNPHKRPPAQRASKKEEKRK